MPAKLYRDDDTAMLGESDRERVQRWLRAALGVDTAEKATVIERKRSLALACGVSPQAVDGWLNTGRIKKHNLAEAAHHLGLPSPFAAPVSTVREPRALYGPRQAWPFTLIDQAAVLALPHDDLMRLEGALLMAAEQLGLAVRLDKRHAA